MVQLEIACTPFYLFYLHIITFCINLARRYKYNYFLFFFLKPYKFKLCLCSYILQF